MATTIKWYPGDNIGNASFEILPAASGGFNTVGFFGASFGFSIRVGEFNETTTRTNANGTSNGGSMPNTRFANATGAFIGASAIELLSVDNTESTLAIRLITDSSVGTQNTSFRAFDRTNINNNPSGVTIRAAEVIKPNPVQVGSGDASWTIVAGSGATLSLDDQSVAATTHDWYLALTGTPTSIGEKTNIGFYFETEFL
jgi:hypothetical protein